MQTASSAKRTCSALRSASEYTATVAMPSSLQASITRKAISPRLAIRIFRNMEGRSIQLARKPANRKLLLLPRGTQSEQRLAVLHGMPVLDEHPRHFPADIRLDFVHELHRFYDANRLPSLDKIADFDERAGIRTGGGVERADNRRLDQVLVGGAGRRSLSGRGDDVRRGHGRARREGRGRNSRRPGRSDGNRQNRRDILVPGRLFQPDPEIAL